MNDTRQRVGMLFAEAVGTFILTMVAISASGLGIPLFTGAAAGFTLATMVLAIGAFSGAHINPAVTIGLLSIRKISLVKAFTYVIAQAVGAVTAWKLYEYFVGKAVPNQATMFDWSKAADRRVFFAEMIGTMVFTFGIAAAVYQKFENMKAAATIGTSYFLGIMVAALGSAAILNPAVAYGVRNFNNGYAFAPILGAIVGMNLYAFFFVENWMTPRFRRLRPATATPVASSSTAKVTRKTKRK